MNDSRTWTSHVLDCTPIWVMWWNIHAAHHVSFLGYILGLVCSPLISHTVATLIIRVIIEVSQYAITYIQMKCRGRQYLCDLYIRILWNCSIWSLLFLLSYCANCKFNFIIWVFTCEKNPEGACTLLLSVGLGICWWSRKNNPVDKGKQEYENIWKSSSIQKHKFNYSHLYVLEHRDFSFPIDSKDFILSIENKWLRRNMCSVQ